MTNETIIFNHSQKLAEDGVIAYTGAVLTAKTPAGQQVTIKETEAIHTYQAWKSLGYQVRKGEKAIAKFAIWKYSAKYAKEDKPEIGVKAGEELTSSMFMKMAAFFKLSQCDKMEG